MEAGRSQRGWSFCPRGFPCSVSSGHESLLGFVFKSLHQGFQPFSNLSPKPLFYGQTAPLEMRNLLKSHGLNNVLLGVESSYRCHQLQCCRWVWQPVQPISCRATDPDSPDSTSPLSLCSGLKQCWRVAALDQRLP